MTWRNWVAFFSLPEMKPSVLMMLAGMSTMLMWESVMRMHTTALAPGLLVKRDLNIQKWHRGLSHVKPETLAITGGVAWPWIEAEGYTTLLCFWWCHSHTREKTHSLHQSEPQIHAQCSIHRFPHRFNNYQQHKDESWESESVQPNLCLKVPLTAGCVARHTRSL